jgi:hypothetical protein
MVFLTPPLLPTLATAHGLFADVAWADDPRHWLPPEELFEVLTNAEAP